MISDADIIKALECCNNISWCSHCPLGGTKYCRVKLSEYSIALINRQNAEIERLTEDLDEMADRLSVLLWHATDGKLSKSNYTTEVMVCALNDYIQECCEEAEAEAIKEFAERLKERWSAVQNGEPFFPTEEIDNLVKEMVGERE